MLCFTTHSQIYNCIFPSALIISVTVISPIIHAIKAATGAGKKDCDIDDKTKKKVIAVILLLLDQCQTDEDRSKSLSFRLEAHIIF